MIEPPVEVSNQDVTPSPRRIGHRPFDLAIALSAIFISIVSLIVGVQHGRTERDLVQASSWPFVQVSKTFSANGSFELSVNNVGVGPAKVESIELIYRDRPLTNLHRLAELCCAHTGQSAGDAMTALGGHWSWANPNGRVLRPGQAVTIFSFAASPDATLAQTKLRDVLEAVRFRGCYCSVFDKCVVADLMSLKSTPIADCPEVPEAFGQSDK